ncbi:angiopoietin-4 [Bacillus rossius redtenbacheri]|uniref:angiopoietin-4 n=1 Tax=Bacillus rossius redtenbacheri TaxID=93214 RepID=UPI002FDDF5A6
MRGRGLLQVLVAAAVLGLGAVRGAGSAGPRVTRTSSVPQAGYAVPPPAPVAAAARPASNTSAARNSSQGLPANSRSNIRNREQYLFNVFEVIVSTLESKLQRIDNLDKAVEHLMRRVETLDSRVADNIGKTDAVIDQLQSIDLKLFRQEEPLADSAAAGSAPLDNSLDMRLVSLDQKVTDIDSKLAGLKNQLDTNFLPADDINAEASEKKPISMSAVDIAKVLNAELMSRVSSELDGLRSATGSVDRKLQFHTSLVTESLGKVLSLVSEVHEAVVEQDTDTTVPQPFRNRSSSTTTTTPLPPTRSPSSKLDKLVQKMHPILSVSEKMDEVWDVVVGTKSSVDDLVPKSDELLTQTQRQERAISDVHADLRAKANKIIANLDLVERRLKKQQDEEAVVAMAQRPVPAELLLDPTIDRLVEFDVNARFPEDEAATATEATPPPVTLFTTPGNTAPPSSSTAAGAASGRSTPRNRNVIFPSVKNKPSLANTTFTTDIIATIKDVKGYSCVDLLNAGMKDSGVYYLQIRGTTYWFLKVYCEQEIADGGWTVIQRRDDFGEPRENFNRDWADYKNGFGNPAKEFWLGNENIYMLTNNEDYMLRIELEDFEGNKRYAQYTHFKIYSEAEYYKLEIDGYEGNAGDSLNDPWYGSNNSPFSTYNRDNDRSSLNCASMLKGGWWWKSCGRGLNGLYLNDPQDLTARQGIVWFRWRGWDYTLKKSVMMIKPRGLIATAA